MAKNASQILQSQGSKESLAQEMMHSTCVLQKHCLGVHPQVSELVFAISTIRLTTALAIFCDEAELVVARQREDSSAAAKMEISKIDIFRCLP